MLAIERKNRILEILQEEKKVIVADLSKMFQVTEETIRRDLEKLEKEGLAKKTYGGAVLNESLNVDLSYTIRQKANVDKKMAIAEAVADMIEDGDHIMLDASSTAVYIAKQIKSKKNLTIITTSIEILLELVDVVGWKVMGTGGTVKEGNLSFIGPHTEQMLASYHTDKAIVSCKGIDEKRGFTDSNEADAHIKKVILDSANTRILVADSTKFDKISFAKSCDYNDIDIFITDTRPSNRWMDKFQASDIEVYYKNENDNEENDENNKNNDKKAE